MKLNLFWKEAQLYDIKASLAESHRVEKSLAARNLKLRERLEKAEASLAASYESQGHWIEKTAGLHLRLSELRERLEVAHEQERRLGDENIKLNRRMYMLEERMKAAIASRQSPPSDREVQDASNNLRLSGYHDEAEVVLRLWRALERATGDVK